MHSEYKRASWLELFYDVAFVALVAQLTYLASEFHHTTTNILNIFIVGYTIFIAWWGTTANRNLQPTETNFDKFFLQLQMVGAFLMSLTMAPVFAGDYLWFFLALAVVRLLQSFMIIRMYYFYPQTRPVTYNILEGFFAASALWALSAFLPDPYHLVVAFMALATDILVPLTRGKGNTTDYLNVYHLQERLGLLLMLVVGESMIVVALANSVDGQLVNQVSIVFSGLLLMVALWWLYFDHLDYNTGVRPRNLFTFLHSHAMLFGGILLVSVGYKLILEDAVNRTALLFIMLGVAAVTAGVILIRSMLHEICVRAGVLVIGLVVFGVLIAVAGWWYGRIVETALAVTLLMGAAALMDQYDMFTTPERQNRPRIGFRTPK